MTARVVGPGGRVLVDGAVEGDPETLAPLRVDEEGRVYTVVGGEAGTGASVVHVANLPDDYPDETAHPFLEAVRNRFSPREGASLKVDDAGDTILWTPQAGAAIRVVWVALFTRAIDPPPSPVEVYFELSGEQRFLVPMSFPFAFAHGTAWEGAPDDPLLVNLSAGGQTVYVNFELEEF